jgi:quinol monooxygenase YgiN
MTVQTRVALFVELKARPGKEAEVASFLAGARELAAAEPLTTTWFAVRFDSQTFGIFDAFESDEGRDAHLNGPIAAALMKHAAELLARAPEIRRAEVLADKLIAAKQ